MVANSRLVLAIGFGGLLLLLAFAGFDSAGKGRQIQHRNDTIRDNFPARTRLLDQIRSNLYLSGTYVRDCLLEPHAAPAEAHRASLLKTRHRMEAALEGYRALLNEAQAAPWRDLNLALRDYWSILAPVLAWNAGERRDRGYAFPRDEVFPRRTAVLRIADQIAGINQRAQDRGAGDGSRGAVRGDRYRARGAETALRAAAGGAGKRPAGRLGELHDEVGQALTGVRVELANLSHRLRKRHAQGAQDKPEEITELVEDSLGVVRNMALLLRPSMLDDLGLVPAQQWPRREVSKRTGLRVRVAAEGVSDDLPEEHKTCIYRIVQESLHNSAQHAQGATVGVTVRQEPECIRHSIQDDGKGFPSDDVERERGMGLLGIEERASHLGGTFSVDTQPGRGATVSIVLPTGRPAEAGIQAVS